MSPPRVETGWSLHGVQAVLMRNEELTVVVLPDLGGKIWEVHDRRTGRQVLWHHPRLRLGRVPFGSGYDDVFHGGWDVLFPNDVPETLVGEPFPDHGELWASAWEWTADSGPDGAVVTLALATPISACRVRRTLTLAPGARHLAVASEVDNDSGVDLPFLWKEHLALDVVPGARVDLGAKEMLLSDFGSPRAGTPGRRYRWPVLDDADASHDMRPTLPASSRVAEFQYATELTGGWCALTRPDGAGAGLAFDPEVLGSCWVFASYGGWRALEVAVLEPCTGYPVSVTEGVGAGTHRVLPAGGRLATAVTLVVYDGMAGVEGVGHDGSVSGPRLGDTGARDDA